MLQGTRIENEDGCPAPDNEEDGLPDARELCTGEPYRQPP